jgi:P4 family phage/plasmid primase-like protien
MKSDVKKYIENDLSVFSIDIKQKQNKDGKWKKDIVFQKNWQNFTVKESYYNKDYNGLALLTGKVNNIIVIDIDNVKHWEKLLQEQNKKEPETVKATSGNGGIHLYFKYDEEISNVKSTDHVFGKDYDIDIRTNGGCIIAPPSKYYNENQKKEVKYEWVTSILDKEPKEIPDWMRALLLNKKEKIKDEIKEEPKEETKIEKEELDKKFSDEEIEDLLNLLSKNRTENYTDWVNVGMCLYNISKENLYVWRKWSKESEKYESGICEEKWKTFKKSKEGLNIGSLLLWCKVDNENEYKEYIQKKRLREMIIDKYPGQNLLLEDIIKVNDLCKCINLSNKICLISGESHKDLTKSMYIEMLPNMVSVKCKHLECFGKIYCDYQMLSKQETNLIFNGDINININSKDDELVEFQYYDIFEDNKLNVLVYDSLTGTHGCFADIIYYIYQNNFIYGEDNNWYSFCNHKWKNIGNKNSVLRNNIQLKLKELYSEMISYYKDNEHDKKKIKAIRAIYKNFDDTTKKNNIMTELTELYTINKNLNLDFTKKLDLNNHLIGFNNGIYDLTKFEFREGNPEDYITMSVGYNYDEKHTEKYKELLTFLQDIQPNKDERDYMLTYLSIGLVGNLLELFTILAGNGRNGKSKLIELLGKTFGEYFGSVQSQMFTRPRPDANSPDPGLLNLMRKRIVIASEPEKNSKLNSGFIKFLTGRDSTTLRNCHSNDMIEFTARFETLLICNDIPDCDDIDNAFSKRLRCINFPTEFVLEPKKDNQKKINTNINENFDYWKLDFMLLLIEYYKKYAENKNLVATENILKWTNQYKENTDLYLSFLNECTEDSDNENIHCVKLYEKFKYWFVTNNPKTKIPSNKEFINNLRKHKEIKDIKINGVPKLGIKKLSIREN